MEEPGRWPMTFDRAVRLLVCIAVGLMLWLFPTPEGLTAQGWSLLCIFAAVIAGLLLQPFPMGPVVLFGLLASALTGCLTMKQAMSGYGETVVWLVVAAFLLAEAVRTTGLGQRISLLLVARLGRSTILDRSIRPARRSGEL